MRSTQSTSAIDLKCGAILLVSHIESKLILGSLTREPNCRYACAHDFARPFWIDKRDCEKQGCFDAGLAPRPGEGQGVANLPKWSRGIGGHLDVTTNSGGRQR